MLNKRQFIASFTWMQSRHAHGISSDSRLFEVPSLELVKKAKIVYVRTTT